MPRTWDRSRFAPWLLRELVQVNEEPTSRLYRLTRKGSYVLNFDFETGQTPSSLVGFTGGTILGNDVENFNTGAVAYRSLNGSITAPAGVPDGGSTVSLLSFALLGLVALRRKLGC
jgi:hypothetical protein